MVDLVLASAPQCLTSDPGAVRGLARRFSTRFRAIGGVQTGPRFPMSNLQLLASLDPALASPSC